MREIKYIVLHCTATQPTASIEAIKRYWREDLGWKSPGYHFIIQPNGEANQLLSVSLPSNGVAGYNKHSIHISYIGGIDKKGRPTDTRTPYQIETQKNLIECFMVDFPDAAVLGHRDFPNVKKACPSFDVKEWLESWGKGHWFKKATA